MEKNILIDYEQTGENIKKYMKRSGLTPKDVQALCGFTRPNYVYNWYAGRSMPSIDNLVILSDAFGVPIDDIIARKSL